MVLVFLEWRRMGDAPWEEGSHQYLKFLDALSGREGIRGKAISIPMACLEPIKCTCGLQLESSGILSQTSH